MDSENRGHRPGESVALANPGRPLMGQTRLVPGAIDALRNTLDWAGLEYDEGMSTGEEVEPYSAC